MNEELEAGMIKSIENITNGTIGCNELDWKIFTPKVRVLLFKHIYEFEFEEETPNIDVSKMTWNELPVRFTERLQHNFEEYAKAFHESVYNL